MQKAVIYNQNVVSRTNREFTFSVTFIVFSLLCITSLATGLCFLLNDGSFLWINLVLSFSGIILSWAAIYISTTHLAPALARKRLMKRLSGINGNEVSGKVVSVEKERTPIKSLPCRLIEIQTPDGLKSVYFEKALGKPPFEVGKEVSLLCKMNFVCEAEGDGHE